MDEAAADALVDTIARGWRGAELTAADEALCRFAERLTGSSTSISAVEVEQLRSAGFGDEAIHDAVQITSYFNYINRVADGLGVEPEDFVRAWGEQDGG